MLRFDALYDDDEQRRYSDSNSIFYELVVGPLLVNGEASYSIATEAPEESEKPQIFLSLSLTTSYPTMEQPLVAFNFNLTPPAGRQRHRHGAAGRQRRRGGGGGRGRGG